MWRVQGFWSTGVAEQSALAFLGPADGFVAIDDQTSIVWQLRPPSSAGADWSVRPLREDDGALKGLEGVCTDGSRLFVVSEKTREVSTMDLLHTQDELRLGPPARLGKLPKWASKKNKGFEGLCIVPNAVSWGAGRLLVVQEGKPKRVGLFDAATLDAVGEPVLSDELDDEIEDLSDVTVREDGTVWLLSDKSCAAFETRLDSTGPGLGTLRLVERVDLEELDGKKIRLQPEGIAFDNRGDLWIATEGQSRIYQLRQVS